MTQPWWNCPLPSRCPCWLQRRNYWAKMAAHDVTVIWNWSSRALQFGLLMCDEELLFLPRGFIVCAAEQIVMDWLEGQGIIKVNACAAWHSSLDQQDRFVSAGGVLLHDDLVGNGNWVDPLPVPVVPGATGKRAYNTLYYTEKHIRYFLLPVL